MEQSSDVFLEALNALTTRIGPANAINILRDANILAVKKLLVENGMDQARVDAVFEQEIKEMARQVLDLPTPSPFKTT